MRTFIIAIILIVLSGVSFSNDFSPTIMKITCPPEIKYDFNGSELTIPFNLEGTPAAVWLVINTNGQAENIRNVRNGNLGWHYVNKIDTTIFISEKYSNEPGDTQIIWDGRDENGNEVSPGTYDYYLWGYDDKNKRQAASRYVRTGFHYHPQYSQLYENGEDGLPLSNPIIMGGVAAFDKERFPVANTKYGTFYKWIIGSDPSDIKNLQTTFVSIYPEILHNPPSYGGAVLDPANHDIFYHTSSRSIPVKGGNKYVYSVLKSEFVTGGEAVIDSSWFNWEKGSWNAISRVGGTSCFADNNFIYVTDIFYAWKYEMNKIRSINYDGEIVLDKMMHDWYSPTDSTKTGVVNCTIDKMYSRTDNRWLLLGTASCLHQMINVSRLFENQDDETDMVVFSNSNGDYFMDNGWEPESSIPWFCAYYPYGTINHYSVESIYRTSVCMDSNNLNIIFVKNYGIVSFGVSTQDGTGIGYMSFADDKENGLNFGGLLCDSGSGYDGFYINNPYVASDEFSGWIETDFVAFDSAHGIISDPVTAVNDKPKEFKVFQNTPNPFNSKTTIKFSIPVSGNVSLEIYNIAGQKITTLLNGIVSAGSHSVNLDATGYSSGIYFYKIKSGKYEKIMKMSLLK